MPGPGPRGVPTAVPNSKGPGAAKSFVWTHPLGQNGVSPAVVSADVGSLTLTGFAPTILTPRRVLPGVGAVALAGLAPTVLLPKVAKPGVGVLTATGLAPAVLAPRVVRPALGALTATGFAPLALVPRVIRPAVGAVTVSGFAPTVRVAVTARPSVGVLALGGLAPTILTPRVVRPAIGVLTVTGFAPTITVAVVARPGVGVLTLTGAAPTILTPRLVKPGVGVLVVAGFAPLVRIGVSALPGVGALSLAGFAPTVSAGGNALVRPGVGALSVTGFAPLVIGDPVATTLPAGGWMQPIRRAKAQPFTVWSYETFAPTVLIRPAQRFHAVVQPRPAIAVVGVGSLALEGFAPVVAVIAPVPAPQPEHEPDATGEPRHERPTVAGEAPRGANTPRVEPAVVQRNGNSPTPRIGSVQTVPQISASEPPAPAPVPAWLATPIVVDVGYATLLLSGFAPTVAVTTRHRPTDEPWSPETEDDAAILWAAYDLLVNA